jgi:hypothetical protein
MAQFLNSLNIFLLCNSLLLVILILNQNESNKELATNTNATAAMNPLENLTWGCFVFQLILLLIKTKTTVF